MEISQIKPRIDAIYVETADLYARVLKVTPALHYGYKILYGPPYFRPPILFVGYQPGGRLEHAMDGEREGERSGWPEQFEYVIGEYRLARQARRIVDPAKLEKSVALNAIFLRARSRKFYEQALEGSRCHSKIWDFCRVRVESIIELLEPQRIVLIGFETARLWGGLLENEYPSPKGRVLTRETSINSRPALSILHLSGARIATSDLELIRDRVLAFSSS